MTNQSEMFLGLSNTGWAAISSLSTFLAVLVALYFPISERFNRKKRICNAIENEIRRNFRVLENAEKGHLLPLVGRDVPKAILVAFTLGQINIDYWEENKQYVSESSLKKFDEYNLINSELGELKSFAQEVRSPNEFNYDFDKLMIAFDITYSKMKSMKKYWQYVPR